MGLYCMANRKETEMKSLRNLSGLFASIVVAFNAYAWMDPWTPEVKSEPAKIKKLSAHCVSNFVNSVLANSDEQMLIGISIKPEYSKGASIDLNADGILDFVFIIPWIGCGLNANGYSAHFIVSDGKGGRMENVLNGYCMKLDDLVEINGKIYMRQSEIFYGLQNSEHNYWVSQIFSFGADGAIKCANQEVGEIFPAATIYYEKPKFKSVKLSKSDLERIANTSVYSVLKFDCTTLGSTLNGCFSP